MFEIQDAAKVITESIDPEAKIIFGTVRDDKLKKNEIKITVIATGFPENVISSGRPPERMPAVSTAPVQNEPTIASMMRRVTEKGKIYNPAPEVKPREPVMVERPEPRKVEVKPETKDDDDDWGAIPAFLRRSRLK
jgi:cell division protein FtsZ